MEARGSLVRDIQSELASCSMFFGFLYMRLLGMMQNYEV